MSYKSWIGISTPYFEEALCRGLDPDLFFPPKENRGQWKVARKVCKDCIHRIECLQFALDENIMHGVWGGTSPTERNEIRRKTGRIQSRYAS